MTESPVAGAAHPALTHASSIGPDAMNPCPTCGRPRLKGVILDHEGNRVIVDGQIIFLTRQETDLLSVFVADPAFTFSAPELADKVWGLRWPASIHSSLNALVLRLRRKLAGTRLRIVAVPRHGYGLRQNPPPRSS